MLWLFYPSVELKTKAGIRICQRRKEKSYFPLPKGLHLDPIYTSNEFLSQFCPHIRQFLCALTSIENLPDVLYQTVVL